MKTQIETIVLTNKAGQKLRVYLVDGASPPEFCIGRDGGDHFSFFAQDAEDIAGAINSVVDSAQ